MNLSTLELAQLRADQSGYWPDTCTIQTRAQTADSVGGWTDTWSNTYAGVACRLAPKATAQREALDAEQLDNLTAWVLTVAQNQVIDETMRVVHNSETYEVTYVEDTHSNRTARRAYLRRSG